MTAQLDAVQYRDVAIFANLRDDEIADFLRGAEMVSAAPFETLIREGDPADSFFILVAGKCVVQRKSAGGRTVDLATLLPKTAFGEMALLANRPRSSSVVASEPATLLKITRAHFARLIEEGHPAISKVLLNLARVLCDRIENVNREFSQLVDKVSQAPAAAKASKELQTFKDLLYKEWAF
jgi:CRP-like cAMP-binding protein